MGEREANRVGPATQSRKPADAGLYGAGVRFTRALLRPARTGRSTRSSSWYGSVGRFRICEMQS